MMLLPAAVLASCNTAPKTPAPTATTTTEAAPTFPNLSGTWKMEIFSRAQERDMGTPNLAGTLTLKSEKPEQVSGQYVATVRDDQFKANPNDTRRLTYKVDSGFWSASKQWQSDQQTWYTNEQLSFTLRPTQLEIGGVAQEEGFPINLQCRIFTKSRVEKPTSGKETYVLTCVTEDKQLKLDAWIEKQ